MGPRARRRGFRGFRRRARRRGRHAGRWRRRRAPRPAWRGPSRGRPGRRRRHLFARAAAGGHRPARVRCCVARRRAPRAPGCARATPRAPLPPRAARRGGIRTPPSDSRRAPSRRGGSPPARVSGPRARRRETRDRGSGPRARRCGDSRIAVPGLERVDARLAIAVPGLERVDARLAVARRRVVAVLLPFTPMQIGARGDFHARGRRRSHRTGKLGALERSAAPMTSPWEEDGSPARVSDGRGISAAPRTLLEFEFPRIVGDS